MTWRLTTICRHVLLATWLAVSGAVAAEVPALAAEDRADLDRIEAYLNTLNTVRARFVQIAPDGGASNGTVYMSRPGKMRIEYDPPVPVLVVANGLFLIFYDKQLEQISHIPLDSTPAGVLLRESIVLDDDIRVDGLERSPGVIRIALVDAADPNAGKLILTFGDKPLELRQWTVIDGQGQETRVGLLDAQFDLALDPDLFVFRDPRVGGGSR